MHALLVSTNDHTGRLHQLILSRCLFDVTWVYEVDYGVYKATHSTFNLVVMEWNLWPEHQRVVELAEALTIYDPTLPVLLIICRMRNEMPYEMFAHISFTAVLESPHFAKRLDILRSYARE